MRILIYKRTHKGDPDKSGIFGVHGCMGGVRGFEYDAVIGVGGMGTEPRSYGIHGRINWVGIGPQKDWGTSAMQVDSRGPQVRFKEFALWEDKGPPLMWEAPMLARRLFEKKARYLLSSLSSEEQREAEAILKLVEKIKTKPSSGSESCSTSSCPPKKSSGGCPPRRKY